jgi:hypothetical protein
LKAAETVAASMENNSENNSPANGLDLGCALGRSQAFGLVASKCSAAQAQYLLLIREQRQYQALGLSWEEFCTRHAGISRSYADQLIRNLKEFGETYFRLSEILHLPEAAYRQIAAAVDGEILEIEGERIPIVPENAGRIRKRIAQLRSDLDRARASRPTASIVALRTRLDECFKEMSHMARVSQDPGDLAALRGLIAYSIRNLRQVPVQPSR